MTENIFGFHIMIIALFGFGLGSAIIAGRWLQCVRFGIDFPRFPKLLLVFGVISSLISGLFLLGVQDTALQYLFATGGLIYLISVTWIKQKEKI